MNFEGPSVQHIGWLVEKEESLVRMELDYFVRKRLMRRHRQVKYSAVIQQALILEPY